MTKREPASVEVGVTRLAIASIRKDLGCLFPARRGGFTYNYKCVGYVDKINGRLKLLMEVPYSWWVAVPVAVPASWSIVDLNGTALGKRDAPRLWFTFVSLIISSCRADAVTPIQ
jgi:hypothetical protein